VHHLNLLPRQRDFIFASCALLSCFVHVAILPLEREFGNSHSQEFIISRGALGFEVKSFFFVGIHFQVFFGKFYSSSNTTSSSERESCPGLKVAASFCASFKAFRSILMQSALFS
jgi:hypothetical protein